MDSAPAFDSERLAAAFRRDGYFIHEGCLSLDEVHLVRDAVAALPNRDEVRRKRRSIYGVRNLFEICPIAKRLALQPGVRRYASAVLGEGAFAVRAIFFDKLPGANWSLFWHQDNVISVREPRDVPGFVGWSQKAGVWQVQPSPEVLARMIAVRVYLDDCGADNGPLRVIPGSHRFGWLDDEIEDWKRRVPEVVCTVRCGGIVAMCPLTLHASAASQTAGHRRVIHMEFAAEELPGGLEWNNRVGAAMDFGRSADDQAVAYEPRHPDVSTESLGQGAHTPP
ncbi:MAG: phytanoyl-CoA dioxygenase family protein [Planctomycetales bacterium]